MPQDPRLTAIVQRMIDAGESEDNIATVIQAYQPPKGDPYTGPDTFMGGFTQSVKDTAVDTGKRIGRSFLRAINPFPVLAAQFDRADENQRHREQLATDPQASLRDAVTPDPNATTLGDVIDRPGETAMGVVNAAPEIVGSGAAMLATPAMTRAVGRGVTGTGAAIINRLVPRRVAQKFPGVDIGRTSIREGIPVTDSTRIRSAQADAAANTSAAVRRADAAGARPITPDRAPLDEGLNQAVRMAEVDPALGDRMLAELAKIEPGATRARRLSDPLLGADAYKDTLQGVTAGHSGYGRNAFAPALEGTVSKEMVPVTRGIARMTRTGMESSAARAGVPEVGALNAREQALAGMQKTSQALAEPLNLYREMAQHVPGAAGAAGMAVAGHPVIGGLMLGADALLQRPRIGAPVGMRIGQVGAGLEHVSPAVIRALLLQRLLAQESGDAER